MTFFTDVLVAILGSSGFANLDIKTIIMLFIACVLLYMGIGKKFEPLLLVPIAFGMLMVNFPLTGILNEGGLFYYVGTSGTIYSNYANMPTGVLLGFCL